MRNEGDQLYEVVSAIYEKNRFSKSVSPSWLATEGMKHIKFAREVHPLGYVGCHLQMRQIARSFCRTKFDPTDPQTSLAPDLFAGTLQERYPLKGIKDEEPEYVLLKDLPDEDRWFNVERMRAGAAALLKHADALAAYKPPPRAPEAPEHDDHTTH